MTVIAGQLPLRIKVISGIGAIAFGIKDSGFSFFLLIFYNQALGMDAALVSLALLIALLVDAVVDPIIGNLSDRTYTRWGRRLPWLYIAPVPLALLWVILWSPPGGEPPSFVGLVGIAVMVRVLLSACEVPSIALVPEITADYDERTTLFRYRSLAGWIGGLVMMVLAYTVFMPGPRGLLEADGYQAFGMFGAVLMALSVLGSAAGLHTLVARLPDHRPPPFTLRGVFGEIADAFSEPAFLIFAAGGLAAYIAQGMTFSLSNYLNVFVWQLNQEQLTMYPVVLFVSVVLMFVVVGPMHRRFGKGGSAALGAGGAAVIGLAPYLLLFTGVWPQPGSNASTAGYFGFVLFGNMLGIVSLVSATSMIAEIVEAFEERTGRRAEGSFYSGNWLIQKCATGAGIFVTGQIIAFAGLASDAAPGEVPRAVIDTLIICFSGASALLAAVSAWWLARFPISRTAHEARLERLAHARSGASETPLAEAARADPDAHSIGI